MLRRLLVLIVMLTTLGGLVSPACAQDDDPLRSADAMMLGLLYQGGGDVKAVQVDGDYAYVGWGPRLVVVDISNPLSPVVVGVSEPFEDQIMDVDVNGDYAYVAAGRGGLKIIDINDKANPTLISHYDTPNYATGVAYTSYMGGSPLHQIYYALVTIGNSGLLRVNVSNRADPTAIPPLDVVGYANRVAVYLNTAYVVTGNSTLVKVDVDPEPMTILNAVATGGIANDVVLNSDGSFAYVAASDNLYTFPTATMAAPDIDSEPVYADGVDISDTGLLYVADESQGVLVYDLPDPENPVYENRAMLHGFMPQAKGVSAYGPYVFAGSADGLHTINVSNPAAPDEIESVRRTRLPGSPRGLALAGNTLYVVDDFNGVEIMDVSTPESPTMPGHYNEVADQNYTTGVAIDGDTAYVANGSKGLLVLDVSNPATPGKLGENGNINSDYLMDVTSSGDYVYGIGYSPKLYTFNVSNPASIPDPGVGITLTDTPNDIVVSGSHIYVADNSSGIAVLHLSSGLPDAPTYVPITSGYAYGIAATGNYLLLTDHDGRFMVFDISGANASAPALVATRSTSSNAFGIALSGNRAVVACGSRLDVFDITNPSDPVNIVAYGPYSRDIQKVAASGDIIYAASQANGVYIFEMGYPVSGTVLDEAGATGLEGITLAALPFDHTTTTASDGTYQ